MRFANEEVDLGSLMEEALARDSLMGERERVWEAMRIRTDRLVSDSLSGLIPHGWDGTEPMEAFGR